MNDQDVSESTQLVVNNVNGVQQDHDTQEPDGTDDGSVKSIGIEGSIGSDTDTSKIDSADGGSKDLAESQEQTRPNSLKKSATFKPVSVTKNFLAKAGTASTPASKANSEKGIHEHLS